MDAPDHEPKFWSNAQTYSMAAICLILGVVVGIPGSCSGRREFQPASRRGCATPQRARKRAQRTGSQTHGRQAGRAARGRAPETS